MTGWSSEPDDRPQWRPDTGMVYTALSGRLDMRTLTQEDRCFLVSELTAQGHTAADIADRLSCSLRLVRQINADPLTAVLTYARTAVLTERERVRRLEAQHKQACAQRDRHAKDAQRFRAQRDSLIDKRSRRTRV